jgi:hypothetical protein
LRLSGTRRLGDRALARPVAFGIALIIAWSAVTLSLATALPRLSPSWFLDLGSTLVNLGELLVPLGVVNSKVSYNVRKRDSGAGLSVLTALNLDREVRLQEAVDAQ